MEIFTDVFYIIYSVLTVPENGKCRILAFFIDQKSMAALTKNLIEAHLKRLKYPAQTIIN